MADISPYFQHVLNERAAVSAGPFILEAANARRVSADKEIEFSTEYVIYNISDAIGAKELLENTLQAEFGDRWTLISCEVTEIASGVYRGAVRMRMSKAGRISWELTTTGGQEHIEVNIRTVGIYSRAGEHEPLDGYDYGLIGPTDRGVKGADIVVTKPEYVETWWFRTADLTVDRVTPWIRYTGYVNKDSFRWWEPGEVLFLGVDLRPLTATVYEGVFRFAISYNATNLEIGRSDVKIVVPEKKGHHYLSIHTEEVEGRPDAESSTVIRGISLVEVHQVYPEIEFSNLGLELSA